MRSGIAYSSIGFLLLNSIVCSLNKMFTWTRKLQPDLIGKCTGERVLVIQLRGNSTSYMFRSVLLLNSYYNIELGSLKKYGSESGVFSFVMLCWHLHNFILLSCPISHIKGQEEGVFICDKELD